MKRSRLLAHQLSMLGDIQTDVPGWDINKMVLYCEDGQKVMRQRNAIYGSAFRADGIVGAAYQLFGCLGKLRTLITIDPKVKLADGELKDYPSLLRNVLMDIHNFSLIALLMLDEDNFNGVETIEAHYGN